MTSTIPPGPHHSWGIRERERAVWAKMLYSNKDKQEKERSKAWPGTFEVMGSEREGSKWEFNLEIQASCGYSWLAAVNAGAGRASLISCAVYSRVIIASHYRATALGRLCYQLQSPHHRGIPHHTVEKWVTRGPFSCADIHNCTWANGRPKQEQAVQCNKY